MNLIHKASHYNQGMYEVIDVIRDWDLNFCLGNTLKYIGRADHKGKPIEDLKKASEYVSMEIEYRAKHRAGLFKRVLHKYFVKAKERKYTAHDVAFDWKLSRELLLAVYNLGCVNEQDGCDIERLERVKIHLDLEINNRETGGGEQ